MDRFKLEEKIKKLVCPVCGNSEYRQKYRIKKFNIIQCKNCSLIRLEHNFSRREIIKIYEKAYFRNTLGNGYVNYFAMEKAIRKNFRKRLNYLYPHKATRLLDIGAGPGFFMDEARKIGFDVQGVEISHEAVKYAGKKLKLDIKRTDLENFNPKIGFDLITAWDVIEHIQDPNIFLSKVYRLLKKNGILIFSTGDVTSLVARLSGKRWHLYNLPEHLYFYSAETIKLLLEHNGFKILSIKRPLNFYSLSYIFERLIKKYNFFLSIDFAKRIIKSDHFQSLLLPVNLYDIMEISAVKNK